MKKLVKIIGLLSSTLLAGIIGISYYTVSHFISRPLYTSAQCEKIMRYSHELIHDAGGQKIQLQTADGIHLSGLVFIRPEAQATLLLCHGWWMPKEYLRHFVMNFVHENIVMFDFRAHGESQGELISFGYFEKNDVKAALEYIKQHPALNKCPVIGLGISMGAAALLAAAQDSSFDGLILDSVFSSLDQTIKHTFAARTGLPLTPFFTVCEQLYLYRCGCPMSQVSPLQWAKNIQVPTLMIHSEQDQLAEYALTKKVFENIASSSKQLWSLQRGDHAVLLKENTNDYVQHVHAFLDKILNQIKA